MEVEEAKLAPAIGSIDKELKSRNNLDKASSASEANNGSQETRREGRSSNGNSKPTIFIQEPGKENGEEERSVQSDSYSRAAEVNPSYSMTVVTSRRNANGTIGSVYSGNKIRHLKKEDGVPLWRKDIQYSFLRAVFENTDPVFTMDDGSKGHNFADIYISAMAKSTKTSKVLREKLLSDRDSALNMAMICLLVNVGRMNTTLNFFPEMRAQLRTYHSIPCLQVHQEPNSQYKGLQDAPRLKSILKGSCEDPSQPTTIEGIRAAPIPRTNPVNLIFVMSQYAPKVSETHFFQPRDFFDLVIRSTWSSTSRATAFLWLMWWYLESDFTESSALNNPFGKGLKNPDEPNSLPLKVPEFKTLTEEQANQENVDTEEEIAYGDKMAIVRRQILEEDETVGPPIKKTAGRLGDILEDRVGASPARSDIDRTRSPSPTTLPPLKMPKPKRLSSARDLEGMDRSDVEGRSRPSRINRHKVKADRAAGSSSPAPGLISSLNAPQLRRARPETSHQRAVNLNRKMRIENILYKKLVKAQRSIRKQKRSSDFNRSFVAMKRVSQLPVGYDSDDDTTSWGVGGLVPNLSVNLVHESPDSEIQDFGGEALTNKKVFDRSWRRLGRIEAQANPGSTAAREYRALLKRRKEQREELPLPDDRYKRPLGTGRRGGRGGRRSQLHRGAVESQAGNENENEIENENENENDNDNENENENENEPQEDQMMDVEMDAAPEPAGADDGESGDDTEAVESEAGDDATEDGMVE